MRQRTATYQKPRLQKSVPRSENLNPSSGSDCTAAAEASSFLSIMQYTMKAIMPAQSMAAPRPTEADTPPIALAKGNAKAKAPAVPIRAKATCKPIASASS